MTSISVTHGAGIAGVLALVATLVLGTATMAAAQNSNGVNPFDALWAAVEGIQEQVEDLVTENEAQQEQIDSLQMQVDVIQPVNVATLQSQVDELNDRVRWLEELIMGDCDAPPAPAVDWHNCNLVGADLRGANLHIANLEGANLSEADLTGADLSLASSSHADLSGAILIDANLHHAGFLSANLSGADLSGANLTLANLNAANLSGANLSGSDLTGAELTNVNFTNANLSEANLTGAALAGANLTGADLSGAILDCIGHPVCT